jgi:hypothetical protein
MKKYNFVQDLFLDLPDTILLVGNGEIENKGELIDSYDFVIRFNNFEIEGHEDNVGSKVDAISFHCSDFTFPHTQNLEKNYLKYKNITQIFTTSPRYGKSKKDILHPGPNTQIINVANPIFTNSQIRLSSGASLAANLSLLFRKKVHLVGFDFMKTGHYWDPNYDRESFRANLIGYTPHSSSYDKSVLNDIKSITFL